MLERKAIYHPMSPQEQFIVPLLRGHIEGFLTRHLAAGQRVLDIGCGRQPFRAQVEAAGCSYVGLDIEQNSEGTVDIICPIDAPLPATLVEREPFSLVLCTEVLEHVAGWDLAFDNLAALTAGGGTILITCPQLYPLHEEPHDYWRPTPHAIRYFAEKAGLRVREQLQAGDGWDVLGTVLACCWPVPELGKSRVLTRLVAWCRTRLSKSLQSGRLQTRVALGSSLYLSNIVVLEKP